jgi:hypothetical protein
MNQSQAAGQCPDCASEQTALQSSLLEQFKMPATQSLDICHFEVRLKFDFLARAGIIKL